MMIYFLKYKEKIIYSLISIKMEILCGMLNAIRGVPATAHEFYKVKIGSRNT